MFKPCPLAITMDLIQKGKTWIRPERGKMKKIMATCALLAGIVGGCATSGELEELGAELKKKSGVPETGTAAKSERKSAEK